MAALDQLVGPATDQDRFAYASQRLAIGAVLIHEGPPLRDDSGGVTSHVRHVRELHPHGVTVEDGAQRGDLGGIDDDQDGLAGGDSISDESHRASEEIALIGVKERLVAKMVV
jgi:hypothetical protein